MESQQKVETVEIDVSGPHGPVRTRIYSPATPNGSGIVWIHGGAFRANDIDVPEADWVSRQLAAVGLTVASVDYRLAVNGVHFPVPSDDCLAAWIWASDGALEIAPNRWHVGGGSAGANLAASVSLQARDEGLVLPQSAVLLYPVMHSVLPTPSAELAQKLLTVPAEYRSTRDSSDEINLNYVGTADRLTHPYAFPAYAKLEGFPPTLIINSDADDLRASGEAFASQLAAAGVDLALIRESGTLHGHLNQPETEAANLSVRRMIDWLTTSSLRGTPHEP
jgi:acetyl esterase